MLIWHAAVQAAAAPALPQQLPELIVRIASELQTAARLSPAQSVCAATCTSRFAIRAERRALL